MKTTLLLITILTCGCYNANKLRIGSHLDEDRVGVTMRRCDSQSITWRINGFYGDWLITTDTNNTITAIEPL